MVRPTRLFYPSAVNEAPDSLPVFSALGHATRWRTFALLLSAGDRGLLQREVASELGIDRNLASLHLKVMREAGLVSADRNGREVTYRAVAKAAADAAAMIGQLIKDAAGGG